ncbi:MAG: hypothetical protein CR972_02375 [Candidatus Moraniibacteriota bacterium]|nr:MAG: hypothetical protein CR972_02375 [Candidatus Moranbacteria bacterium]
MANFKTHISWGVVLAFVMAVGFLICWNIDMRVFILVFSSALIGSFLPDVDSDSGVPFRILFYTLSVVLTFFSVHVLIAKEVVGFWFFVLIPLTVFIFVRFVLGDIFKKFTRHRGIWHSIPAAILAGLVTMVIVYELDFLNRGSSAVHIGVAMFAGYMAHLFLDEVYASVNFSGKLFKPKKSLGTAMKWYSSSLIVTVFVYSCLLIFWLFALKILL